MSYRCRTDWTNQAEVKIFIGSTSGSTSDQLFEFWLGQSSFEEKELGAVGRVWTKSWLVCRCDRKKIYPIMFPFLIAHILNVKSCSSVLPIDIVSVLIVQWISTFEIRFLHRNGHVCRHPIKRLEIKKLPQTSPAAAAKEISINLTAATIFIRTVQHFHFQRSAKNGTEGFCRWINFTLFASGFGIKHHIALDNIKKNPSSPLECDGGFGQSPCSPF